MGTTPTETSQQLSRRELLLGYPLALLKSLELGVCTLPIVAKSLMSSTRPDSIEEQTQEESIRVAAQPNHIQRLSHFSLPNHTKLCSVGVLHLEGHLDRSDDLQRMIALHDVIAMESESVFDAPKHIRLPSNYFARLRCTALEENKILYDIDVNSPVRVDNLEWGTAGVALASGLALHAGMVYDRLNIKSFSKRAFIRTIGWLATATSLCPPQAVFQHRGKDYPSLDLSFCLDGRTVLMLANTLDIAEKYPGKSILMISGDLHAKGVEYYMERPRLLALKTEIYRKLYVPHIAEPAEKLDRVSNVVD